MKAVRDAMFQVVGPQPSQREFWQLHSMYTLRGWQGTAPVSSRNFARQATAVSTRAACEYTDTYLALERADPPNDIDQPFSMDELRKLDTDWGLCYLITRICLACAADDQQVVQSALPEGYDAVRQERESRESSETEAM
jgi:hypothetical protein